MAYEIFEQRLSKNSRSFERLAGSMIPYVGISSPAWRLLDTHKQKVKTV
jgi:hypothetical protein